MKIEQQIGICGEACYEKEESAEKFNNILDSDWSRNIFCNYRSSDSTGL